MIRQYNAGEITEINELAAEVFLAGVIDNMDANLILMHLRDGLEIPHTTCNEYTVADNRDGVKRMHASVGLA